MQMKFVVSSVELLNYLQTINKVVSSKSTVPALDNFLFKLEKGQLIATASDLETTLTTTIALDASEGEGVFALQAKILIDTLKEFPEQPLSFEIDLDNLVVKLNSQNGVYSFVAIDGNEYPKTHEASGEDLVSITVASEVLFNGLNKTLFATADDELRIVMNGVFIEIGTSELTFVASDAHKLVRYRRFDGKSDVENSFILPKKPATVLKNILLKSKSEVGLDFDSKNAYFTVGKYKLVCRLVEGRYPSYNSVIPTNNPNKVIIDRASLYNTLKRVSVFANAASNLIKFKLTNDQIEVSAQDIDFAISAKESLRCEYDGEGFEIGFKGSFLIEILANIESTNIVIELSDSTRAGLFFAATNEDESTDELESPVEDVLMLLMPMMINS